MPAYDRDAERCGETRRFIRTDPGRWPQPAHRPGQDLAAAGSGRGPADRAGGCARAAPGRGVSFQHQRAGTFRCAARLVARPRRPGSGCARPLSRRGAVGRPARGVECGALRVAFGGGGRYAVYQSNIGGTSGRAGARLRRGDPELPHPRTGEPVKEPLHALYRQICLEAVAARLAAGERQMVSFFPDVRVRIVGPDAIRDFDPDFRSFFNVNTPEDWKAAEQMLAGETSGETEG